jgi:hypothetical protein
MKTTLNSIRIVGTLTLLALLTCCNPAWAQAAITGDFVLPYDVQWSGATLSAGQYHFTLQSGQFGGLLLINDSQQNGKMWAVTAGIGPAPDHSSLTIVRRKGKWHVASLALEPLGTTLKYSLPPQIEVERKREASTQVIPVRVRG